MCLGMGAPFLLLFHRKDTQKMSETVVKSSQCALEALLLECS